MARYSGGKGGRTSKDAERAFASWHHGEGGDDYDREVRRLLVVFVASVLGCASLFVSCHGPPPNRVRISG